MKTAIIIGAGPAGLTAAYELVTRTDITPIVLEKSTYMGGISRTVNYKGNRIDIGGHRFFSKSDRVMKWWLNILPIEPGAEKDLEISYQNQKRAVSNANGAAPTIGGDQVMLIRNRLSRIYFMKTFFTYPIALSADTLKKLGLFKTIRIGLSYLRSLLFPIRDERSLEDFFINRFGRDLYLTFFKSYTEKVWGVPCKEISAEWGAQRIKGLSITKALSHMLSSLKPKPGSGLSQKSVETSLIDRFMYPKFGPGQMWEEVAVRVTSKGGRILTGWTVDGIEHADSRRVLAVRARHCETGETTRFEGDYFFSTMPIQELIEVTEPPPPAQVREVGRGLVYRDFITVGLLCKRLKIKDRNGGMVKDNWIYIQEPVVSVGRLQIFNNWSPAMVADPENVWIGLEYFCYEGDSLWNRSDGDLIELAKKELQDIEVLARADVLDATVIRMAKTYPAYFGSYTRFPEIVSWARGFENLFLIGRNGMHKYNNQDHSMLTAMVTVDNLIAGSPGSAGVWELNTEQEYHEKKK
jgi:protoporphyrinogen oxidase